MGDWVHLTEGHIGLWMMGVYFIFLSSHISTAPELNTAVEVKWGEQWAVWILSQVQVMLSYKVLWVTSLNPECLLGLKWMDWGFLVFLNCLQDTPCYWGMGLESLYLLDSCKILYYLQKNWISYRWMQFYLSSATWLNDTCTKQVSNVEGNEWTVERSWCFRSRSLNLWLF